MADAPGILTTPEVDQLIAAGAAVAIGISGGKDSHACVIVTWEYLDSIGHSGPRILIHSDLGKVEWDSSIKVCRELSHHLGAELVVLRREAGDLMDRWLARWASSVKRYAALLTVTLVPPWSTPALRFCTSEMKTHLINAYLRKRFKGMPIVNVTGIRREESSARSKCTIASPEKDGLSWNWRPIAHWTKAQVFAFIDARSVALHPGYRIYGLSRVSCRFCIMSNEADLTAASAVPESHDLFRQQVGLEIVSTFSFQSSRWLGDIAPHLLSADMQAALAAAKVKAAQRVRAEAAILPGMLYVAGWPTRMLTDEEANILASARRTVSELIGIEAQYLDVQSIHARYRELMDARPAKYQTLVAAGPAQADLFDRRAA